MLMQTYGGQRAISRVSLYLPTWLSRVSCHSQLTRSQASGNFSHDCLPSISLQTGQDCKHGLPLWQSNCFIHRTISPSPLLPLCCPWNHPSSLNPPNSRVTCPQKERTIHWWASNPTQTPLPWNHCAQPCLTPCYAALMAFGIWNWVWLKKTKSLPVPETATIQVCHAPCWSRGLQPSSLASRQARRGGKQSWWAERWQLETKGIIFPLCHALAKADL